MSLQVIHPGMLTTVQDLGRKGYQQYGVVVGGAMDTLSLRIANLLVGNEEGEAALEVTLIGPTLAVQEDMLMAFCGGDLSPTVDGRALSQWRPVLVRKGSVIKFGACRSGSRSYVTVSGGFDIPQVLGSRSTYLRGGLGGFEGRMLMAGDALSCKPSGELSERLMKRLAGRMAANDSFGSADWYVSPPCLPSYDRQSVVRVMRGTHFDSFTSDSRERLFGQAFEVNPQSDRMGYRLTGSALRQTSPTELLSEAVSIGTIQVPPDGQPIILLADRQTTGGYPRIAYVASANIPVVGQFRPGQKIRFEEITLEQAERLYLRQAQEMREIRAGIQLKIQ